MCTAFLYIVLCINKHDIAGKNFNNRCASLFYFLKVRQWDGEEWRDLHKIIAEVSSRGRERSRFPSSISGESNCATPIYEVMQNWCLYWYLKSCIQSPVKPWGMIDLVHDYFMAELLVFTFISKAGVYHRSKERVTAPKGARRGHSSKRWKKWGFAPPL